MLPDDWYLLIGQPISESCDGACHDGRRGEPYEPGYCLRCDTLIESIGIELGIVPTGTASKP